MQRSKIKKESSEDPSVLFLGIPGPGLIGTMSMTYIIHALKMDLIGEIESSPSSVIFVDNGQMIGPVRIYKKDKIFAIISDIPIDYDNAIGFTESVIDFSKRNHIDFIVFLSGIQVQERNMSNLKTYGLVTHEKLEKLLYDNAIPKFLSGVISGPDATILSQLRNSLIPTIAFHTECNYFFPDPDAAIQTIKIISQIIKTEIDLTEFKKQADYLRLQNRQLMEDTLNVLQTQKESSTIPPQIYK
ncbi:MAG: proteasome assembly chaperone family protein [Thaumarchaeota archaeon]|nr:proteasome assembly chaperone family protein [Nitrososphaerota archaeon]MDE1817208.1 proteasome assembly chaperone family protein [Nitrososphaerota archaeon]